MIKRFMRGRVAQIKIVDEKPFEDVTPVIDGEMVVEAAKDIIKLVFWGAVAYKLLDTGCKILIKHL